MLGQMAAGTEKGPLKSEVFEIKVVKRMSLHKVILKIATLYFNDVYIRHSQADNNCTLYRYIVCHSYKLESL